MLGQISKWPLFNDSGSSFTRKHFHLTDAFADAADAAAGGSLKPIHIRIQQRNGRKTLTTVQGIPSDYDQKKIVRAFKKVGPSNN